MCCLFSYSQRPFDLRLIERLGTRSFLKSGLQLHSDTEKWKNDESDEWSII
jgi:hypothetical protein